MSTCGRTHLTPESVAKRHESSFGHREVVWEFAKEMRVEGVDRYSGGDPAGWLANAIRRLGYAGKLETAADRLRSIVGRSELVDDLEQLAAIVGRLVRVWHLSDLHFGPRHRHLPSPEGGRPPYPLSKTIESLFHSLADADLPDLVAVSGDLAWTADAQGALVSRGAAWTVRRASEFRAAAAFLRRIAGRLRPVQGVSPLRRVLVVPGNHDSAWLGERAPLGGFRQHIRQRDCVTPYTRTRGENPRMRVVSGKDAHGVPVSVARYLIGDIELVVVLLVSHFYEGRLAKPGTHVARRYHRMIARYKGRAASGGGGGLTQPEYEKAMDLIEQFGIHVPMMTAQYSDTVRVTLRRSLEGGRPSDNEVRLCLVHAPLVQLADAALDATRGGASFLEAGDLAMGEVRSPVFHAVLSGHLHSARVAPLAIGGWVVSAGTASAQIDPSALPTQETNSFSELRIRMDVGGPVLTQVPWEWEDGAWRRREDRARDLPRRGVTAVLKV